MQTVLVLGVLALATVAVARATRGAPASRAVAMAALCLASAGSAVVLAARAPEPALPRGIPRESGAGGYVTSRACLGCHPGEHASFSRTYHRTMTQVASPGTVLAPFERRGDDVWHDGRRVLLTTGSHREQAYWAAGERPGELELLPVVWMVREAVLVPREEAFLTPPEAPLARTHWAGNCIACHAVAGQPRRADGGDAFDTRVAELGIACESCHGPGAAHVGRHRDPVERYMQHASKAPDPTIVQPARVAPERSAAICGQCHAYSYPRDEQEWWSHGYARTFRAGDALEPSRHLLGPAALGRPEAPRIDADVDALFWDDGSIRVGGREYNGLVASPCYERGQGERKLTCLSCHTMHAGDPAGQLAPDRQGDRACTSCHAMPREHSHHREGSPGAACTSCHMPRTSYALLSAVRSHRIDSPSVDATVRFGKPNACNLCHLDRTLSWTRARLAEWYGLTSNDVPAVRARTPEGVYGALAGDAAVRVLVADALGSAEARAAVAAGFAGPVLTPLASDPYAAVRFVARRSLERAPPGGATIALDPELVKTLLAARDHRAITIAE